IKEAYERQLEVAKRKDSILKSIQEQDKLTPELKAKIENTFALNELEDLYLPYRPKRKTRATMAIEKGLEPLAEMIFTGRETDPERRALSFLNDQVKDIESALQGARDIIAEWINENGEARNRRRNAFEKTATSTSKVIKKNEAEADEYRDYFDFSDRKSTRLNS